MKCLTIKEPYAHLIAIGEKRVENRTWLVREKGFELAIHAGKSRRMIDEADAEAKGRAKADDGGRGVVYPVIRCPKCGSRETHVTSTQRPVRYHKCDACGEAFKSAEACRPLHGPVWRNPREILYSAVNVVGARVGRAIGGPV